MALIPKNEVARKVMDHLPCSRPPQGGFFSGGSAYCIGVAVSNVGDAFELGATIGAEVDGLGDIGFDKIGTQHYVVFRSAEVAQGIAPHDQEAVSATGILEGDVLPPETPLHRQARELFEELQAKEAVPCGAFRPRM